MRSGCQSPRVEACPSAVASRVDAALELCELAGLHLDPWQQHVFAGMLGEREDGRWAAREVGLCVPRQNGKGSLLEARELAGLFLFDERLIIHSAHQFDTSLEAFYRLLALIENTPSLLRQVRRISRSHGEEGIALTNGCRIRFRTRTKGGGRGFTADCLILDEAMILPESSHGALMPTLSARPNPQILYTGSAVDQLVHEHGVVFARVRERGIRGDDPELAFFEWSADFESPDLVDEQVATDPLVWAVANPGLGIRIDPEHVALEQRSMDRRTFAVERLGVGDWPATDGSDGFAIDPAAWRRLEDATSVPVDPVVFAFDVSPDRGHTSVTVAARREDGLLHVELVDRRPGTGWVPGRLRELVAKHRPRAVVCDGVGPAASLAVDVGRAAGIEVQRLSTSEHTQACGFLFDLVEQATVRHVPSAELSGAVKGAARRPLGDAWAWSRKNSGVDIGPLVSATLGLWVAGQPDVEVWVGW